jgi:hypothetical protein
VSTSRRTFLIGVAASATVAAPAIAQGRVQWRMVTAWPRDLPGPGVSARRISERVRALTAGRFEISVFAAGEIVPALGVFDAVASGVAQAGHGASFFQASKAPVAQLFTTLPFGLSPVEHHSWLHFGGGQALWDEATALLPARGVDTYTQGLMDLGATLCTQRRPACLHCPVAAGCVARREGAPERYPVKTRRGARGRRSSALLWLRQGRRWWLVQRPDTGVWAGLWSLPEFDSAEALQARVAGWRGQGEWLEPFQHALTHFEWTLQALAWTLPARSAQPKALPDGRWFEPAEALALGLPAPIRRLLAGAAGTAA